MFKSNLETKLDTKGHYFFFSHCNQYNGHLNKNRVEILKKRFGVIVLVSTFYYCEYPP